MMLMRVAALSREPMQTMKGLIAVCIRVMPVASVNNASRNRP
jgi:hypothetical protein